MPISQVIPGATVTNNIKLVVPASVSLASPQLTYIITDVEGQVWGEGQANILNIQQVNNSNIVTATALASIPSSIPPSIEYKYNFQWFLKSGSTSFTTTELFTVISPFENEMGALSSVEIIGAPVTTLTLLLDNPATNVQCSIYQNNTMVALSIYSGTPTQLSQGYMYQISQSISSLPPSVSPYSIIWSYTDIYGNSSSETSELYILTPSMTLVMDDIKKVINKARAAAGDPVTTFSPSELASYVRQGADTFNGTGQPTNFNMTNAVGPIRQYWMGFSEVVALKSQMLSEGIRAFNFSGQAISLDVDRSGVYENMANTIESSVMQSVILFKDVLAKRGLLGGDGNISPTALSGGAIDSLGLALSPVSNLGWGTAWWNTLLYL